jgi:hypothetical protein
MLKYRTMRVRGTEGIATHILNVDTTWNRLFSFTTSILYPPENDHALGSQLDGLLWTQRGSYNVLHPLGIVERRTSGP